MTTLLAVTTYYYVVLDFLKFHNFCRRVADDRKNLEHGSLYIAKAFFLKQKYIYCKGFSSFITFCLRLSCATSLIFSTAAC